jgi:anti-sigma regulatory factor (Ser/Thr protein kinase)
MITPEKKEYRRQTITWLRVCGGASIKWVPPWAENAMRAKPIDRGGAVTARHVMTTVELRNDLHEVKRLHETVAAFMAEHRLDQEMLFAFDLALEEVVVNVIHYAYEDASAHTIQVRLRCEPDAIVAEVEDDGRPYDPLQRSRPADLDRPLHERRVGGLGVHCVRELMDGLDYQRDGGRNRFVMKKRRPVANVPGGD